MMKCREKISFFAAGITSCLILNPYSASAEPENLQNIDEVVVSTSRYAQTILDSPSSVSLIKKDQIRDSQPQINLSESLVSVPGLYALNRQNYAQDLMISIRGFGANSAFGARGIKIFVDGIPATMPDGQSQLSHIDLSSAEQIEVLRGPFSALYGTSAGGVMNVTSESGEPGTTITPYASYGSFNTSKVGTKISGEENNVNYLLDTNTFRTDGYRDHSNASRDTENAKLRFNLTEDTQVTLIANRVNLYASDPLGLTADQLSTPLIAGNNANRWNTRKTVTQVQGGAEIIQRLDADSSMKLVAYTGTRNQFGAQAVAGTPTIIAACPLCSPASVASNGIIALDRQFYGLDGLYQIKSLFMEMPIHFSVGLNYGNDNDHSTGYCSHFGNLTNCSNGGTSLSSDATYISSNFDQYTQMRLDITNSINVTAGLRHTVTTISASDNLAGAFNNSKSYERALPVASVSYFFNPLNHLYVSAGQGYDTPTLNQIKYSCTVCSGSTPTPAALTTPNFLNAATTSQVELGYKTVIPEIGSINVALFDAVSNNEIVALANISGKTVYQNANGTARKGFEISGHFDLNERFYSNLSYSYTNAQVTDTYKAGASTITAGNAIPGVPQNKLFGELAFHLPQDAINVGVEVLGLSQMYAADDNNATSNAAGYVIANVRAFAKQNLNHWNFTEFARLNNVSDVQYVGSVIINQQTSINGQTTHQYFEPAVGRNWVLGASASYLF